jgi:hypothetical protein
MSRGCVNSEQPHLLPLREVRDKRKREPSPRKVLSPYFAAVSAEETGVSIEQKRKERRRTPPPKEAEGRRDPPNACVQLLRTAATCTPLLRYLKINNKMSQFGKSHWGAIRSWTRTAEGMEWMRMAQLDPLSVQLDHICAKNGLGAGYDSVYNCYFVSAAPNSWFADFDTKFKRDYIGTHAVDIAKRFSKWINNRVLSLAKECPDLFDQSKFDPVL